jgi:hypothetical protein
MSAPVPIRAPSLAAISLFALACVVVGVSARTDTDADLWGHLAFGRDILAQGGVPLHDSYSFTSDQVWVNHEWLAEVVMWSAWTQGGSAGLVGLKLVLLLAAVTIVWWMLGRLAVAHPARVVLTFAAWVGIISRAAHMRPQVFSLLFFAALLAILLERRKNRGTALLYSLPLLFALWVNLHGGWIVGGGVLALWSALHLLGGPPERSESRVLFVVSAACLLATLANPYGVGMWTFLAQTVGFARDDVADWQPVFRYPSHYVPWILATVLTTGTVLMSRPLRDRALLLLPALLWVATLRVNRLDAFFALTAVFVAGICSAPRGPFPPNRRPSGHVTWPFVAIGGAAVAVLALMTARTVGSEARCLRMNDVPAFPERAAWDFIEQTRLSGRIMTFYDYGQYAIWHFAPRLRVSLDGRRETIYSEDLLRTYQEFITDPAKHAGYPEAIGSDHVWLPNRVAAGQPLARAGWRLVFRGTKSSIWTKQANLPAILPAEGAGPRCFPGP